MITMAEIARLTHVSQPTVSRVLNGNPKVSPEIRERVLAFLPKFDLYIADRYVGFIRKEFTFFKPSFQLDFNGWRGDGDWMEWDYTILDAYGRRVASVSKELWNWTDTYVLDIAQPQDALCVLMIVLAIDAEKCSRDNN